jgi:hypothetical protein
LLNFFRSTDVSGNQVGGDFYRLFEFVHVPSPFVGTETMLDPTIFQTPDQSTNPPPTVGGPGTEGFRAPFNWVSNYRDPGKINLNTMNSADVGNALRGQPATALPDFANTADPQAATIELSRRGAGNWNPLATAPVAGLPSIMPFPFRSGAGGDMVPDLPGNKQLKTTGVNATLLRQGIPPTGGGTAAPLCADPRFDVNCTMDFANSDRNAAFRYASLERLANLTTTRSNVYAIWLTVGYFEVFPNPPDPAVPNSGGVDAGHPDGYQIGAELGSDTGEIVRHRGFYLLDRTIPVGFERGYNHNVDRAIILKRFIE